MEAVRSLGYNVFSIAESAPGITDEDVLNRARSGQSVLLTADKDFGELVYRQQRLHTGIVLLRLTGLAPAAATLPHGRGSVTGWNHEVTFLSRAREQAVRLGPA